MTAPLSISETDAEALLTDAYDAEGELTEIADVLAAIRAAAEVDAGTDFSHLIAAAALESRATPLARFNAEQAATKAWELTARLARPVAVGAVAVLMLVVSSAGLAYAANGAKPGDFLYGLDRAAEVLGIGDGGAAERLEEAEALVAAGEMPYVLSHAATVIAANQEAQNELLAAANRLQADPPGPGSHVADKVGALLSLLHDATIAGALDNGTLGSEVSNLARGIGGPTGDGAPPFADGSQPPGQATETAPGNSETTPAGGDTTTAGDEAPGGSGEAPGQTEDQGQSGDAPGRDGENPGNSETAPGQSTTTTEASTQGSSTQGSSGTAPGQSEDGTPGGPEDTPGGTNPGGGGTP